MSKLQMFYLGLATGVPTGLFTLFMGLLVYHNL